MQTFLLTLKLQLLAHLLHSILWHTLCFSQVFILSLDH